MCIAKVPTFKGTCHYVLLAGLQSTVHLFILGLPDLSVVGPEELSLSELLVQQQNQSGISLLIGWRIGVFIFRGRVDLFHKRAHRVIFAPRRFPRLGVSGPQL